MFINKAQNLNYLAKFKIKNTGIPKFIYFNVLEWKNNRQLIIKKITKRLDNKICIRSSFYKEDSSKSSLAGKFESFINISNNKKNIIKAVNNLINQYQRFDKKKKFFFKNYLLIQNFVKNSICSGVVTNYTLGDGAPYYSINYNDQTSSTLSVTSGDKNSYRVLHVSRNSNKNIRSIKFKKIIDAIKKIEKIYKFKPLDIEFALNKSFKVFILQIRPISTSFKWKKINEKKFNNLLKQNEKKFRKICKRNIKYGKKGIFGLMPDWNPAEIIGIRPSPLAISLYRWLITDEVWAKQRTEFGYRDVRPNPLIVCFCGQPYVDIRASLNSFIPAELSEKTAKKFVDAYLEILLNNPSLHDKLEFDIALTAWTPSFKRDAVNRLTPHQINQNQIDEMEHALKLITRKSILRLDKDIEPIN